MLFDLVEPDLQIEHFGSNASQEVDDLLFGFGHDGKELFMACRCQERRDAIRKAMQQKSAHSAAEATKFVVRTVAEDVARSVNIRSPFKRRNRG